MTFNYHVLMDVFEGAEGGGDAGGTGDAGTGDAPGAGDAGQAKPNVNGADDFKWPENWKEQLPEELRSERAMDAIADIPSLAKSYVHAQKMVGQNKAIVPDPKLATAEDWRNFFVKAGLPEKIEEYDLGFKEEQAKEMPEGFLDQYKEMAHKLNILPHQAKEMVEWYQNWETQYVQGLQEKAAEEMEKNLDGYRQITGQAFEKKIAYANKVLNEFGSEDVSEMLKATGLSKHPEVLKMFASLGEKMFGEDVVLGDTKKQSALTPEEATSKWNEIRGDQSHPYWNANHPSHKEAVKKVSELMSYIHGG